MPRERRYSATPAAPVARGRQGRQLGLDVGQPGLQNLLAVPGESEVVLGLTCAT